MNKSVILFFILLTVLSCKKQGTDDDAGLKAETLSNVSYGQDPKQKMDVYLPEERTSNTPVIIMVHGGAWMEGDKADFTQFVAVLQQRLKGYAVVNINYRLATLDANHFPTQEQDMKAAVDFLISKTSAYSISDKFVLLGASAGGHMALLQAYKYEQPKIKAVVNFFGPTDMTAFYNSSGNPIIQFLLQTLMAGVPSAGSALYSSSSPVTYVKAGTPPTLILHGDLDEVVPYSQATILKAKLEAAGVPHQLVTYTGLGHDIWPADKINDAFSKVEAFVKAHVD